jgi:NADPH-dependent 2,4-dienoyl-CoA reductase/sulfur reductase-like enzyme
MNRRDLFKFTAMTTAATFLTGCATANKSLDEKQIKRVTKPLNQKQRVIIIGGGYAGLTVAKNIKINNKEAEVLVFEPKNIFASCPYSNLWLGGVEDVHYTDLIFSPLNPASKYEYEMISDTVVSIDKQQKRVSTANGEIYEYSLLVIATGVEYDYSIFGLDDEEATQAYTKFPASYSGGQEQLALKQKIEKFQGGTFVITVPKGAYRCPPAPYERAALMAQYFKKSKIDAKIVVLDPREKPTTKAKGFLESFNTYYKEYIDYRPLSNITHIDVHHQIVSYEQFDIQTKAYINKILPFDDANIIPGNKASKLLVESGLEVTPTGWGRVKTPGFRSVSDDNIYIVGDVLGEYPFPKSGQMAHSCGVIVGEQIARRIQGLDAKEGEKMPHNVCYSMVSSNGGIYVTHDAYIAEDKSVKVKVNLEQDIDKAKAEATHAWYAGIMSNIFE